MREVWRGVPLPSSLKRGVRDYVRRRLDDAITPRLDRATPSSVGPVTVAGFHAATLGLGRAARMVAAALEERRIQICVSDVTDFTVHAASLPAAHDESLLPRKGPLLAMVNAPETPRLLQRFGAASLRGRHRIGYWTWELPRLPSRWAAVARYLHEIWVPSRFVLEAVQPAVEIPVRILPYPVAALLDRDPPLPTLPTASADRPFTVLSLFDARSSVARKNPMGAVTAFTRALGGRRDAKLLLKVSNPDRSAEWWRELGELAAEAGNVLLVTEALDDRAMAMLVGSADLLLSLHRSEGFGLTLAEAMCCGRTVMATGWSGNMSFMSAANSLPVPYRLVAVRDPQGIYDGAGQQWAEPDLDAAVALLRALHGDRERCRALGRAARADAMVQLSAGAFWSQVPESVRALTTGQRSSAAMGYASGAQPDGGRKQ